MNNPIYNLFGDICGLDPERDKEMLKNIIAYHLAEMEVEQKQNSKIISFYVGKRKIMGNSFKTEIRIRSAK